MPDDVKNEFSAVRLQHARECLSDAKTLFEKNSYKSAANRAYYTVFHAMRAVLALDGIDMKHHSGVIAEFRRRYIKTSVFPDTMSDMISALSNIRTDSDYDDLFIAEKEDVAE